jgi:hypothetical protein
LVQTFVDIGTLLPSISTNDNQVIFGRRGTGKTHALVYTLETARTKGASSVYVDLRAAGSSGGIYSNPRLSIQERATRLLVDVLEFLHTALTTEAINNTSLNLAVMGPRLDALAESATQVRVIGDVSVEDQVGATRNQEAAQGVDVSISKNPAVNLQKNEKENIGQSTSRKVSASGALTNHVHFGSLSRALVSVIQALPGKRLVLALDEWVAIPFDLQPYLADLLRRAFFPVPGIVTKIAAIEQRSTFKIKGEHRDYIGIELGGDVSTAINLDDFMVFENDEPMATRFLRELIFKHYRAEVPSTQFTSADSLVRAAFTQVNAFEELVIAAEGVPRDAINILSIAAQKALDQKISIPHIRAAARIWYLRGKEVTINSDPNAQRLLHWIIDQVIGARKSRAFLLRSGTRHELVDTLFDERVLHVIKRGISARDQPGVRYDAYKIDYGAYVDLISTNNAPGGLFALDETPSQFVDVPPDDYRAIRRAILDISEFEATTPSDSKPADVTPR